MEDTQYKNIRTMRMYTQEQLDQALTAQRESIYKEVVEDLRNALKLGNDLGGNQSLLVHEIETLIDYYSTPQKKGN